MDIKGVYVDVEILNILSKSIINDVKDSDGNSSRRYLKNTLELFGRLTASISNNSDIWRLYAELILLKNNNTENQKAIQYFQRAYGAAVSNPRYKRFFYHNSIGFQKNDQVFNLKYINKINLFFDLNLILNSIKSTHFIYFVYHCRWFTTVEDANKVLNTCLRLAETSLNCIVNCSVVQKNAMLGSAKLCLQSVIKKLKDLMWEDQSAIAENLIKLEEYLKIILEEINTLKNIGN
jgi:hypothetical protein